MWVETEILSDCFMDPPDAVAFVEAEIDQIVPASITLAGLYQESGKGNCEGRATVEE